MTILIFFLPYISVYSFNLFNFSVLIFPFINALSYTVLKTIIMIITLGYNNIKAIGSCTVMELLTNFTYLLSYGPSRVMCVTYFSFSLYEVAEFIVSKYS